MICCGSVSLPTALCRRIRWQIGGERLDGGEGEQGEGGEDREDERGDERAERYEEDQQPGGCEAREEGAVVQRAPVHPVDKAYGQQKDRQSAAKHRPRAGASMRRRFGGALDGE